VSIINLSGFLAGIVAGVTGLLIWNWLLKSPKGVEGLVIGVFCNLIAFAAANKLSTNDTR